jgi:RNA polymerase subunit RPABC4/transcription elongation factor Spt4
MVDSYPYQEIFDIFHISDLPRWWCIISIAFGVIILLILIIAYFKGRSMVRTRERSSGIKNIRCNECGTMMSDYIDNCPSCNSQFTLDKYICPRCRKEISKNDPLCPYCSLKLRNIVLNVEGLENVSKPTDPDIMKLKMARIAEDRRECINCGAILEKGSVTCSICGLKL